MKPISYIVNYGKELLKEQVITVKKATLLVSKGELKPIIMILNMDAKYITEVIVEKITFLSSKK